MTPLVFEGVVFGILEGLLLGLIPLIAGMKRNQPGLAFGGFFGCIVAGAVGGLILGIPCAALFWWFVKKTEAQTVGDPWKPGRAPDRGSCELTEQRPGEKPTSSAPSPTLSPQELDKIIEAQRNFLGREKP